MDDNQPFSLTYYPPSEAVTLHQDSAPKVFECKLPDPPALDPGWSSLVSYGGFSSSTLALGIGLAMKRFADAQSGEQACEALTAAAKYSYDYDQAVIHEYYSRQAGKYTVAVGGFLATGPIAGWLDTALVGGLGYSLSLANTTFGGPGKPKTFDQFTPADWADAALAGGLAPVVKLPLSGALQAGPVGRLLTAMVGTKMAYSQLNDAVDQTLRGYQEGDAARMLYGASSAAMGAFVLKVSLGDARFDLYKLGSRLAPRLNPGNYYLDLQSSGLNATVGLPPLSLRYYPRERPTVQFKLDPPQEFLGKPTKLGDWMHEHIAKEVQAMYPDVKFRTSVLPGQNGVDMEVVGGYRAACPWQRIEIKPNNYRSFLKYQDQVFKWGLKPSQVRPFTYDRNGNVYNGFIFE